MRASTSSTLMSGAVSAAPDPQGIAVGGASLIPTIRIQHRHDDNIFSSDILEESSTITNLTPDSNTTRKEMIKIFCP